MKSRNISYFRKEQARKVMQHPASVDLRTLLSAGIQLCRSKVVKRHIAISLQEMENRYRLTA